MRAIIQGREDLVTGKKYNKGKKKLFIRLFRLSVLCSMFEDLTYFADA